MRMICPNADGKTAIVFEGTPEELFKFQQLIAMAQKNGGQLDDLSMVFLNTMMDNAKEAKLGE